MPKLTSALYAYEATERFAPFSSRFDDYLRGKARLTPIEARGFALFTNPKEGNCIACHVGKTDSKDPTDWIFTDFTYDALGAPRNPAIPANADPTVMDLGLCKRPGLAAILPKEIKPDSLCGAFKVPTLRNVAVVSPYYHNGAFTSLRDAVAFYATRDTDPKRWYPKLKTGEADKFDDLPGAYKQNVNTEEVPYDRRPGQRPRLSDQDVDALGSVPENADRQGHGVARRDRACRGKATVIAPWRAALRRPRRPPCGTGRRPGSAKSRARSPTAGRAGRPSA